MRSPPNPALCTVTFTGRRLPVYVSSFVKSLRIRISFCSLVSPTPMVNTETPISSASYNGSEPMVEFPSVTRTAACKLSAANNFFVDFNASEISVSAPLSKMESADNDPMVFVFVSNKKNETRPVLFNSFHTSDEITERRAAARLPVRSFIDILWELSISTAIVGGSVV